MKERAETTLATSTYGEPRLAISAGPCYFDLSQPDRERTALTGWIPVFAPWRHELATAHPFNVAADELLKDPGLKDVFKVAIEKGYALVARSG
jgi:hypothetical protein